MTDDERIEKLLNRFGQTISDLPKPWIDDGHRKHYAYPVTHHPKVTEAVNEWSGLDNESMSVGFMIGSFKDYICHLCDVIDKLEIALETAAKWADCSTCAVEHTEECGGGIECNYQIYDGLLSDVSEEDLNEEVYIDNAD